MKLGFLGWVGNKGSLLKTGQSTSYVTGDNGTNQFGIAKAYSILNSGQFSGTTNIVVNSKTDAHSNICVQDLNTGLIWSQTVSASVGPASNGKLPWTTSGSGGTAEGIFPYVAAANAANLAGYSDWRIPNVFELFSICDQEAPSGVPDSVAFPSFPSDVVWSSTTRPNNTANAQQVNFLQGLVNTDAKTNTAYCILVRGGTP